MRRAGSALALTVGLVLVAACASEPDPGTVRGRLMMEGGFANQTKPVPGVVTIERGNGKTTRVKAGRVGGFTATIPVGTVHLTGRSPNINGGESPCAALHPVKVREGRTTTADVVCFIR